MKTAYETIIDVNRIASRESTERLTDIVALAQSENVAPASTDKRRTLLLAIDVQNDFMEDIGSLAVSGSRGDVQRLTTWMYHHIDSLTQVICSLDCHAMMQIFHPVWWIDQAGKHPEPFTIISVADVVSGKWRATHGETERSLAYLRALEETGKKELCIWPYHCLEGSFGAKLEGAFTQMLYFHAAARGTSPTLIYKGQNPYTEMYGIIKAEYDAEAYVNHEVLHAIAEYDAVYIAGEASSHCVLASLEQIVEHYASDRSITSRITLLEDCMSPIVGFEDITRQRFEELQHTYGIQIKKSTEVTL